VIETLPVADKIVPKKITQGHVYSQLAASKWSLPAILCLQALISLCTLHNTAFQDEALYLYAGSQIIHSWLGGPAVLDPYAQYFSGYLNFYPVIGGALDMLGGLEAARAFSLLCMLLITACAYYVTKKIFGRDCAIWAAALLAFQAPILFLGRLATYDALCLLCLTLAMALSIRVSTTRSPWWALAIGPLLFLAVVAKYAGLLFVPSVFALLVLFTLEKQGWRAMFVRLGLALFMFLLVGGAALLSLNKDVLMGISSTTTNRVAAIYNPPSILLTHIVEFSGVALLLAFFGLLLLGWKHKLIPWLLFGSALLAPAYHLYKGELVSLDKHLAFGMVFIAPLMGYAVTSIAKYQKRIFSSYHWMSGVAVVLIVFSLGLQQSQYLYNEWITSTNMTYMLETQIRPGSGHYLAEDYDVCRYYQQQITSSWQWNSLDYFAYTDKSHQLLNGKPAYSAALHDGYFSVVELSFGYNASLAQYIRSEIALDHNYDLVAKVPYKDAYGTGNIWIWRKHTS
jgi:Dolichyl-phosphate-mannose-protein mannosyltransferase